MGKGKDKGKGDFMGKGKGDFMGKGKDKGKGDFMGKGKDEQGPFPLGAFPPGSYPAQLQRLYENLPTTLKEAYRKEVTEQGPMSEDDKDAYKTLAEIFSQMEATNTWIEMTMERMERMPSENRDSELKAWRDQLADQMKEWEDFAKVPVKVIGSVS
jgi:predicted acyl esterase